MRLEFWNEICAMARIWGSMLVVASILLVLIAVSFPYASKSSGAYYVNIFSLLFLFPTTVGLLFVLVQCRRLKL